MRALLDALPDLQPEAERGREVTKFRKIRLPSGYTMLVFSQLTEYDYSTDTRVSVYPPESDCGSKDDRVAELLLWSQDVPALLAMCGYKEPDDDVRACTGCGKCNVCRKKTDEPYRGPLATQGPNDNCKSGCHDYAWHCGRCGGCTSYQGHHWSHCKVTGTVREFHMCCPDDCELPASDEGQR